MPTLRHILHHAFWFTLFGPLIIGLSLFFLAGPSPSKEVFAIVYCLGAIPALVTGVGTSCLPKRYYQSAAWRIAFSATFGACSAFILFIVLFGTLDIFRGFSQSPLTAITIFAKLGAFPAALLSLVITRLPGYSGRKER